jgi:hypothetical protein
MPSDEHLIVCMNRIATMATVGAKVAVMQDGGLERPWGCNWHFDEPDRGGLHCYTGYGVSIEAAVEAAMIEGEIARGMRARPRKSRARK